MIKRFSVCSAWIDENQLSLSKVLNLRLMKDLTETLKDFILPVPDRPSCPRENKADVVRRYKIKKPAHLKKKP